MEQFEISVQQGEKAEIPIVEGVGDQGNEVEQLYDDVYEIRNQKGFISKRALIDDQFWSYLCLAVAILGVLIMTIGAFSLLAGNISLGAIEGLSGSVIEGISALAYKPRKEAQERLDFIYNNILEEERINKAIELTKTLDGESQKRITETIIHQLIEKQTKNQKALRPSLTNSKRKQSNK
jgi:hypothetical protein